MCPAHVNCYYYRTAQGAEIDLIIEVNHAELWAIEIKRSLTPTVSKGFHIACADINEGVDTKLNVSNWFSLHAFINQIT